jgi:GTP-binding protein
MNKQYNVKFLKTVVDSAQLEEAIAEVVFVGRSNVGKSSVINAICGTKIAYTSKTPGRTRTINIYCTNLDYWIVDLPGYGYAEGPVAERMNWQGMIEGYLKRQSLRMVFMIIDIKVGPTKLDRQMVEWLQYNNIPYCIVANKSDKINALAIKERLQFTADELEITPEKIYLVSCLKKTGISELTTVVLVQLGLSSPRRGELARPFVV